MGRYLLKHGGLLILAIGEMLLCYFLCHWFPVSIWGLVERLVVCALIPLSINYVIYCRNNHFHMLLVYLKKGLSSVIHHNQ